jgi:hypothetical protein
MTAELFFNLQLRRLGDRLLLGERKQRSKKLNANYKWPAYLSTPVNTIPCKKTRWAKKKTSRGIIAEINEAA